jgi:hypothetical protein
MKTIEKWTKISFLKILGEKYKHFRRHLECSAILIFHDLQQIFYYGTGLDV